MSGTWESVRHVRPMQARKGWASFSGGDEGLRDPQSSGSAPTTTTGDFSPSVMWGGTHLLPSQRGKGNRLGSVQETPTPPMPISTKRQRKTLEEFWWSSQHIQWLLASPGKHRHTLQPPVLTRGCTEKPSWSWHTTSWLTGSLKFSQGSSESKDQQSS